MPARVQRTCARGHTPFLKSTATDGKGRRAAWTWGTTVGKCQGRLTEVSAVPAEAAQSRPAQGRRPNLSVTWGNSQRGHGQEAHQGFGDIWL